MKIIVKLIGLALCLSPLSMHSAHFVIHDLGESNKASGINNNNVVVGKRATEDNKYYDFIWEKDKGVTYFTHALFEGLFQCPQPPLVNNNGTIAGILWKKTDYWVAENTISKQIYLRDPDGSYRDIGAPPKWENPSFTTKETVVNDQRLGLVAFNDKEQLLISNHIDPDEATEFAVWQNGEFHYIDPNALSAVCGMNNEGLILGKRSIKKGDDEEKTFVLYDFEQNTTIGITENFSLENGFYSEVFQLNDHGQCIIQMECMKAGAVEDTYKGYGLSLNFYGFLWDQHNGLLPLDYFFPQAINNKNQMLGEGILENESVPCLWDNGKLKPVEIDDPDALWSELSFSHINDSGHIIGGGVLGGKPHAFILEPRE